MTDKERQQLATDITLELSNRGQIIEGGWKAYELLSLRHCSELQCNEMRKAFYLGAQHLFASIMSILEPGTEPTDKDMNRVTLINEELNRFMEVYRKHN